MATVNNLTSQDKKQLKEVNSSTPTLKKWSSPSVIGHLDSKDTLGNGMTGLDAMSQLS